MKIEGTYWRSLTEPVGVRFVTTWPRWTERLRRAEELAKKNDAGGVALVTFRGDRRAKANVETCSGLVYDFDDVASFDTLVSSWCHAAFVHTTFSSTPEAPRARAYLPTKRPITGAEYARLWPALADVIEKTGQPVDRAASDASRLSFLPSTPVGKLSTYRHATIDKPFLDVDDLLARVPAAVPPPPPAMMVGTGRASASVIERARAYLAKCEIAISGQGGSAVTFNVCQKLTRGFELDTSTAFELLLSSGWNAACQPPWSVIDLARKVNESARAGRMPVGTLRDAQRRRAG